MRALVLAAGVGSRISDSFPDIPKCLVPVINGRTILDIQLEAFRTHGIDDIVIATGYKAEAVRSHCLQEHSWLEPTFVYNSRYAETNYVYTLHLCAELFRGPMIMVHGDLVFDPALVARIAQSGDLSHCVAKQELPVSKKDFKCIIRDGRVKQIGVECKGSDARDMAPMYYLTEKDAQAWSASISEMVSSGNTLCYAEDALNTILTDLVLVPVFADGMICDEIDDIDDLQSVRATMRDVPSGTPSQ